MKIYTRGGDAGETGIWGGVRLAKDDVRVEAIGAVDECNAALGIARAATLPAEVAAVLLLVQNTLLVVGADLMAPRRDGPGASLPRVSDADVLEVERAIDAFEARLPELRNFILPGGTEAAARLHLARTVCRRAERRVATLARDGSVSAAVTAYLNRLSDLLFVVARTVNAHEGTGDVVWMGTSRDLP